MHRALFLPAVWATAVVGTPGAQPATHLVCGARTVAQCLSAGCLEPSAPAVRFQPRPHAARLAERVLLRDRYRALLCPRLGAKADLQSEWACHGALDPGRTIGRV